MMPGAVLRIVVILLAIGAIAATTYAASAQRALRVTADPIAIAARGGETTITVRVPAGVVGSQTRVTLSTELGAFAGSSGLPQISAELTDVGNSTLGASVKLFSDGRVGSTVVRAQIDGLFDTVTVRFVGEPTSLRVESPGSAARFDASRTHSIRLLAADATGFAVPEARVTLEFLSAPDGAVLRSSLASSESRIVLTANDSGEAWAVLASPPGDVRIRAASGSASITLIYQLYGEPRTLRLVPVAGLSLEAGSVQEQGAIQAHLLDQEGNGVPGHRISFRADGGLKVEANGDRESLETDALGRVRVHLDGTDGELGPAAIYASWSSAGRELEDELEVRVTGEPIAMYMRAQISLDPLEDVLIEEYANSTKYEVRAEVVDRLGQRVAGSYQVRWVARISDARAQVYPQVSVTEDGVATAVFDLQHVNGRPQTAITVAQAHLIARAQVNNTGAIRDLIGTGLPLRSSWNRLIWRGEETTVSEAVASIQHVVSSAWGFQENRWQAWFSEDVPGAIDFTLKPGDEFYLVLRSAALLEDVERR